MHSDVVYVYIHVYIYIHIYIYIYKYHLNAYHIVFSKIIYIIIYCWSVTNYKINKGVYCMLMLTT